MRKFRNRSHKPDVAKELPPKTVFFLNTMFVLLVWAEACKRHGKPLNAPA